MELIFKGKEEFLMGICQSQFYVSTRLGHRVPRYLVRHYVSVRVFLGEINTCVGRLSKADWPPQWGWALSNSLMAYIESQDEEGSIYSLHLTVFNLGHGSSPVSGLRLGLESLLSAFLLLRPLDSD